MTSPSPSSARSRTRGSTRNGPRSTRPFSRSPDGSVGDLVRFFLKPQPAGSTRSSRPVVFWTRGGNPNARPLTPFLDGVARLAILDRVVGCYDDKQLLSRDTAWTSPPNSCPPP